MRTFDQIVASILAVVKSAATLQVELHKVAMECLEHAESTGDATLVDRLIKELEKAAPGQRTATLKEWFTKYSPIRWSTKEGNPVGLQVEGKNKDYTPFDVQGAAIHPYYEMGKETRPREITVEGLKAQLLRLSKQIENAETGKSKAVIKEGEDIAELKRLARAAGLVAAGGRVEIAA